MAAGWITMLSFWVLMIVGAIVAVRWMNTHGGAGGAPETPLQILRRRFAAGDLTKEQFEAMKRDVA
jgi:putative membrane protein